MMTRTQILLVLLVTASTFSTGCYVSVKRSATSSTFYGYAREISISEESGAYENIFIDSPTKEFSAEVSDDNRISVTTTIQTGTLADFYSFSAATTKIVDGSNLILKVGGDTPTYCSYDSQTINGETSTTVTGVCFKNTIIRLPLNSPTKVFINGEQVTVQPRPKMSSSALISGLNHLTFDKEKLALVRRFVADHADEGRFASVSDVADICREFTFDGEKVEVAKIFSGKVHDPNNAYMIADAITFSDDKLKAIKALSQ